jgi:hypothetical protein
MGEVNDIVILVVDKRLIFTVNGENYIESYALADRYSGNGNMYLSSPWYPAALGTFGNLKWVKAGITAANTNDLTASNFVTRMNTLFTTISASSVLNDGTAIQATMSSWRTLSLAANYIIDLQLTGAATTVADATMRPIRLLADWSLRLEMTPSALSSIWETLFWLVQTDSASPTDNDKIFSFGFLPAATGQSHVNLYLKLGLNMCVVNPEIKLNELATIEIIAIGRSVSFSVNGVLLKCPQTVDRLLGDANLRFLVNSSGALPRGTKIKSFQLKPVQTSSSAESIVSKGKYEGEVFVPVNFELTFNLFVRSVPTTRVNILHYTATGDDTSRIPAIYLNADTTYMVLSFSFKTKVILNIIPFIS